MHIDIAAQYLPGAAGQTRVTGQLAETFGQKVHREQGADFLTAGLGDTEIPAPEFIPGEQFVQMAGELLHFALIQEVRLEQKAALLELVQLLLGKGAVGGLALNHFFAAVQPGHVRLFRQTGGVRVLNRRSRSGNGSGGRLH